MTANELKLDISGLSASYPAGTKATFFVIVSGETPFNLEGGSVCIEDDAGHVVVNAALIQDSPTSFITDSVTIDVPKELGEYFYLINCFTCPDNPVDTAGNSVFDRDGNDIIPVAPQRVVQAFCSFESAAHQIGMSVWGPSSPVVAGQPFEINVGIQCDGQCHWNGVQGTIWQEGRLVHSFSLSESEDAKDDDAFFTAKLDIPAPSTAGVYEWRFLIDEQTTAVPHSYVSRSLFFAVCDAPSTKVTVQVRDSEFSNPLPDTFITVMAADGLTYRAQTDSQGTAQLDLPFGGTEIRAKKTDYKTYKFHLQLEGEDCLSIELSYYPDSGG